MEIRDYVSAIRRRIWLPILLPLVAGALTVAALLRQPPQYEAMATVIVPALSAKGFSTSAVTQYVSTYKDVLVSGPVVFMVAQKTGASPKALASNLSASTATASSNIIQVTFIGHRRDAAPIIVKAAAVDALDVLLGPQIAAAKSMMVSSQSGLDEANSALADFTNRYGLLFPDQEFRLKQGELSQLLVQLEQARLANDSPRVAGLQSIITARQKELATLAQKATQYLQLVDAKTSAESVHNHAVQQLADDNAMVTSNHDPGTVSVRMLGEVSRLPSLLRFGGIAVGVALLLSLAFLVLLELIRPARRLVAGPTRTAVASRIAGRDVPSDDGQAVGVTSGRR